MVIQQHSQATLKVMMSGIYSSFATILGTEPKSQVTCCQLKSIFTLSQYSQKATEPLL